MNYTQLIRDTVEQIGIEEKDIADIRLNIPAKTITIVTTCFTKYAVPFPKPDDEDFNQEPQPRPKKVKAVKKT